MKKEREHRKQRLTMPKKLQNQWKNVAKQVNGLKGDRETFEIGVKEVLDEYYGEEALDL